MCSYKLLSDFKKKDSWFIGTYGRHIRPFLPAQAPLPPPQTLLTRPLAITSFDYPTGYQRRLFLPARTLLPPITSVLSYSPVHPYCHRRLFLPARAPLLPPLFFPTRTRTFATNHLRPFLPARAPLLPPSLSTRPRANTATTVADHTHR